MCVCVFIFLGGFFNLQVEGSRGEKGQKGEPAIIEPVSMCGCLPSDKLPHAYS